MNIHDRYGLVSRIDTNRALRRWTSLSHAAFFGVILLSDIAIVVAMSWLTGVGYHLAVYNQTGDMVSFLEVGLVAAIIFVLPNLFRGEYAISNFFIFKPHLRRTIGLWNVTMIYLLALGFLAHISAVYSRGWMIVYYGTTICLLLAFRYMIVQATLFSSRIGVISAQRIFLFGTGKHIGDFVTRYKPHTLGVNVVGCRFLTPLPARASAQARRKALARDLKAAAASARMLAPDAIFLMMPWSDTETIDHCVETLLRLPTEIHLGVEPILDRFEHPQLSKFGAMASLRLAREPISRLERLEKRAFDLIVGSLALLLLTPVLIIVAIAIKLDSPGPVFFLQRRLGFNQRPFQIIKFRSMRTLEDGSVVPQAKKDDPRITAVGAWLRRWNLDELPQLFNVIMGDMSLVGPRPHALSHDREYERRIALYARRHNVKPGITGWAQIHGFRGETNTDYKMCKRVEYDLYYIDNRSLFLDLRILVWTVISPTSYRNAY